MRAPGERACKREPCQGGQGPQVISIRNGVGTEDQKRWVPREVAGVQPGASSNEAVKARRMVH